MPDTDPRSADAPAPEPARDPEAAVVRANVLMRLLGEGEGPTKIGRFTLLERVAEGGMGVVFAAYDPELDRKVAVKLLRRDKSDASVRKRIVREAQAMAKLSHPNVAQIYEVGAHDGGVFIAMEFVRGETLRAWQKQRDWREILATYVQAGRGLAAAHAAGLVHRDFKPDNAIVGRDGRVRVLDFGLARAGEIETTSEIETQSVLPAPRDDAFGTPLTHAGSIMGTPAYMAPEQFLGEEVTAKADQFALCVSLWEGLFGERPFAGTSRADLIANVTRGRIREPPKSARVPAWVRAVLVRGLAVGPSERYATTDALLAALENDPSRRRRRITVAAASVVTIAAMIAGVEGYRRYERAQNISACEAAGASIDEVWNAEARTRVREGLLASGVSYAPVTAEKVMPWLDDQAQAWRGHTTAACMSTTVHETWDADTLHRATWCLDEARLELASLVTELGRADASVVQRAVSSAASLGHVSMCLDTTVLANLPPPPHQEDRAALAEVRVALADARTLLAAGKYADALAGARPAIEQAEALGWPPLVADAHLVEGRVLQALGSYAESEAALVAAYMNAAKVGAWGVAGSTATTLVFTVGVAAARPREGMTWAAVADVMTSHSGDPLGLRQAARELNLVALEHNAQFPLAESRARAERALAIRESALGRDHPEVAQALLALGNIHLQVGANAEAELAYERALSIREQALGPDHPDVAASLNNLALIHVHEGAYGEARLLHERALAIKEKALGADHPDVATSLDNLANVLSLAGEHDKAIALSERALTIDEKVLGRDHPGVANTLGNLASLYQDAGDSGKAKILLQRALAIWETWPTDHFHIGQILNALAMIELAAGESGGAKALLERALAVKEAALGGDHPDVGVPLVGLAEVALAQLRPEDATRLAERGLRVLEDGRAPVELVAEARLVLARALWDAPQSRGRDRDRATALAAAARDALASVEGQAVLRAKVDAWVAAHPQPR